MSDPRLPPLPAGHDLSAAAFWWSFNLRRNLRKRSLKLWALGAIGIYVLQVVAGRARPAELGSFYVLILPPLMGLFFGSGVVREEIEDQTLTYPFARPVGRHWLYGARVLASAAPVVALTLPFACLAGLGIGPQTATGYTLAALLSGTAYTCLFALSGQLIKWPAWFGLAYLLFWEGVVGRVPGFLGRLTLSTHLRGISGLPPPEGDLSVAWVAPAWPTSLAVLLGVTLVTLWLAGLRVQRKEFVLTR